MTDLRPVALVCSVRLECESLVPGLEPGPVGGKPAWAGRLEEVPVRLLQAGMGKVNAAQALTALLEREPVGAVLGFGVAGAYPGSRLGIGEVALASSAIYADEGVEAPGGWFGTEGIGIPLAERDGTRWFNQFPADPHLVERARRALADTGREPVVGPFLTVSACSGTTARGQELAARWKAVCEGMEGAALAQVAALYGVPFLELRAVSNAVEDRDLSRWRLSEAAGAAQEAVRAVLRGWRA